MAARPNPVTARRCGAQLLSGPRAPNPTAVAARLLAVQAQDPRGFRLAVRARTTGVTAADVDGALADRSLLVTWLNRGTLHLVTAEDYWWLHALTTPPIRPANARRLAQTGVSPDAADRAVRIVARSLADDGPLTGEELRSRLEAANVPTAGQALVHILVRASLDGLVVRGPVRAGTQAYVLVEDWLGTGVPCDRQVALAELARRYLVGHGPATDRDLAVWAGLTLGAARTGLRAIAPQLVELAGGLVDLAGRAVETSVPAPLLLGPFDPLLHGWRDRRAILGDDHTVVTTNGIFRPILLAGGQAVATWGLSGGAVRLRP
ncbi:MAG: winged helix DNA-binding domain-containing protein, partial [Acidimicrobiales bacterium]